MTLFLWKDLYMINIAILDDNEDAANNICSILKQLYLSEHYIYLYTDTNVFLSDMENKSFDIVFLDIVLGDENGIELANEIIAHNADTNIIFVSAYMNFCSDVYSAKHIYFLTKPISVEHMQKAVEIALDTINKQYIMMQKNKSQIRVSTASITYIEGVLKSCTIHFNDGKTEDFNTPLSALEKLLEHHQFIRIHQSFLVNMDYITQFKKGSVTLKSGKTLSISRKYSVAANDTITKFLGGI